ncbi:MAG: isocitrate lyase/phosphoenolpyruvate mutase family protein [Actinomycetota bacterium]|nr:isocitrate lyase/phosphoenolpyruvate mutase family protein [Actinomycetota bacterium]
MSAAGVARISYGPFTQRVAMDTLSRAAANVFAGGTLSD